MNQISYNYYNVPIGGGGYVTGIEFDGSKENILYIRTDIGGLYRFDRSVGKWISLMDFVTEDDLSETYPAAVCSENERFILYAASAIIILSYVYRTITEKALNIKECRQGFMEIFQEEEPAADLR